MKNKKVITILVTGIVILGLLGVTFAWFYITNTKESTYKMEGLRGNETKAIDIIETVKEGQRFMPGVTISDIVTFENNTEFDQLIRAKVSYVWENAELDGKDNEKNGDNALIKFNFNEAVISDSNSDVNDKWIKEGEYYYYMGKVASQETTKEFLKSLNLSTDISEEYMNATYKLKIDVEAVQADGEAYGQWKNGESDLSDSLIKRLELYSNKISTVN